MDSRASAVDMKDCCKVCFSRYSETDQRPRVLPCGHSYCSLCISIHLEGDRIVCPNCRKEHTANVSTDFPINYELENNLTPLTPRPVTKVHSKTVPFALYEGPGSISRLLCSPREEICKKMGKLEIDVREKRSNLQGHERVMNSWMDEHLNELEFHLSCAQKHCEMLNCISKENKTVKDISGQADIILQQIRKSDSDLNKSTTNDAVLLSLGKSSNVYDAHQMWNAYIQEMHNKLNIRSQELRDQTKTLLDKMKSKKWTASPVDDQCQQDVAASPVYDQCQQDVAASPVDDQRQQDVASSSVDEICACGGKKSMLEHSYAIQEKLHCLLDSLEIFQEQLTQTDSNSIKEINQILWREHNPFLLVSHVKDLTPYARALIESNRVFAIRQHGNELYYSKISLDKQSDICVHTLRKDVVVPRTAVLLQHEDVVGADVRPGLTFLDLAAEGRPLGRLRIRLDPDKGNYPLNFHLLCTGERESSYAQSQLFKVYLMGRNDEQIFFGDYEKNNGEGGRGVVPGVDWSKEWKNRELIYGRQEWEAGSVLGWGKGDEEKASQFIITTKDIEGSSNDHRFGKLDEEGLDILKEALSHYCHKRPEMASTSYTDNKLKNIIIEDCGIILPRT